MGPQIKRNAEILLNQLQNKWLKKHCQQSDLLRRQLNVVVGLCRVSVDVCLFLCVEAECMHMCGGWILSVQPCES